MFLFKRDGERPGSRGGGGAEVVVVGGPGCGGVVLLAQACISILNGLMTEISLSGCFKETGLMFLSLCPTVPFIAASQDVKEGVSKVRLACLPLQDARMDSCFQTKGPL